MSNIAFVVVLSVVVLVGYSTAENVTPENSVVERLRNECHQHKDLTKDDMVASNTDSSCVALKTLYVLERFFETEKPEKTKDESNIDAKLVGSSMRFIQEVFDSPKEEGRGVGTGRQRIKKMMLPLLVGIILKVSTIIPVLLGKLTFMGVISLFASKLSLAILGLLSLKKMWESQHHHHSFSGSGGFDEHSFGGGSHRRRTIYVVRGRDMGSSPAVHKPENLAYSAHIPEQKKTKVEKKHKPIS